MDAFESLVAMLLKRDGYWTRNSFKVELTHDDKLAIGKPSSPRWEIDVVAYKGQTNEVLAVECKSLIDSKGVRFRDGRFEPERRYKLFSDKQLRDVVLGRLRRQLVDTGAVGADPPVTLCLAAGHIASVTNRELLEAHMAAHHWRLLDEHWVLAQLGKAAGSGYENDVAHIVAKMIIGKKRKKLALA